MPTSTVVSVEEYVSTDYSPDREYLNGAVVKRNLGERSHLITLRRKALSGGRAKVEAI